MADRRKLMAGILNLPESARKDLAQRAQDVEREGVVGMLRKATGEMYNNPIVNTAIGFTPGVGDVQAAGETFAALQRGAPWQETAGYAVGMLPFVPALRTTWHGSPHGFTKFDMSKIGTGEGAQAYGHGLYLAESPGTARSYQESLSTGPERFLVNGEEVLRREAKGPMLDVSDPKTAAIVYAAREGDKGARKYFKTQGGWGEKAIAELDAMKGQKITNELPGYLYKVELPDEQIAKMLDYDLPLANQPEQVKQSLLQLNDPHINEALSTSPVYNEAGDYWSYMGNTYGSKNEALKDVTPAQLISGQRGSFKSPQEASQRFYEAGIPGIQYLDQASRGAGEGTRNYVVFSDEIPQILERNGQPIAQALREYKQQFPEGMLGKTEMFETGTPTSFEYIRNTEKSPYMGEKFGQDIEPAGRYLSYKDPVVNMESMPDTWETGQVSFNNPLVVNFGESYGTPTNWKNMLSESFGGKTGKDLSKAIAESGYDGIVTVDKYGTSEIVDLSNFLSKEK